MKFNCYIIDDKEEKHAVLTDFLVWLTGLFPNHEFQAGFAEPKKAPYEVSLLMMALEDPFGLILLDANMNDDDLLAVAKAIIEDNNHPLNGDDVLAVANQLASNSNEVMLGAALYLAAKRNQCRLAWISNFEINLAIQIGNLDALCPNLPWTPGAVNQWRQIEFNKLVEVLRAFHLDPSVNDAVNILFQPPDLKDGNRAWNHDSIGKKECHYMAMMNWLNNAKLDAESAKALLCGNQDWKVNPAGKAPRMIKSQVIRSALLKLGLPVNNIWTSEVAIPVPCEPFLPFLISLRALFYQMELCEKFHPPTSIQIPSNGHLHFRIDLKSQRKDDLASCIDINLFENSYKEALENPNAQQHRTTARLVDLTYARVQLTPSIQNGRFGLFAGTEQPVAHVSFDKNTESPAILISWPIQS